MEANYTLLQTNLSLQKETIIAEAAIDQTDRQEIGFLGKNFIFGSSSYVYSSTTRILTELGTFRDRRVTVTRTQSRSAVQSIQIKTVGGSEKPLRLDYKIHLQILVKI